MGEAALAAGLAAATNAQNPLHPHLTPPPACLLGEVRHALRQAAPGSPLRVVLVPPEAVINHPCTSKRGHERAATELRPGGGAQTVHSRPAPPTRAPRFCPHPRRPPTGRRVAPSSTRAGWERTPPSRLCRRPAPPPCPPPPASPNPSPQARQLSRGAAGGAAATAEASAARGTGGWAASEGTGKGGAGGAPRSAL